MRRCLRTLPAFLILLLLAGPGASTPASAAGLLDWGSGLLTSLINRVMGGRVVVQGLSGSPSHLVFRHIELHDTQGVYALAEELTADWSPLKLLSKEALFDNLSAEAVHVFRMPVSSGGAFSLPVSLVIRKMHVTRLELDPPVAGQLAILEADGSANVPSLQQGQAQVTARRLDQAGSYALHGDFGPDHITADVTADEPANGIIASLAKLPDLGALTLKASIAGPKTAEDTKLAVSAGPLRASASGTLNLEQRAADLNVLASAPAMAPRPDLAWQGVSLSLHVQGPFTAPDASGQLRIAQLQAGGASVQDLAADLSGNAGEVALNAVLHGVRIPGSAPDLLAAAPVEFRADVKLSQPDRPVSFALRHPLIVAQGTATTGATIQANATLELPQLQPFAAIAGFDLHGRTALRLNASLQGDTATATVDGTIGVTGGTAPAPALIGPHGSYSVAVRMNGGDFTISRAEVRGAKVTLTAQGTDNAGALDLTYALDLPDVSALSARFNGSLQAKGALTGPTGSLSVATDLTGEIGTTGVPRGPIQASLRLQGLPGAPSGSITAQGVLDQAPLTLTAQMQRNPDGSVHAQIQRADWKSAHVQGDFTLPPGATIPTGQAELRMTRLADLDPLVGQSFTGSVAGTVGITPQAAVLDLQANDAGMPGARVGRALVRARIADPLAHPVVDGSLEAQGIEAGGIGGSARVEVRGPQEALAVRAEAGLRHLAGADARLNGTALVNAPARQVTLQTLQADWKNEPLRLLAPARIDLANGIAVNDLRVAVRQAVLEVAGEISPALSLTASIRDATPDLLRPFRPGLNASGTLNAEAHLTGTLAQPAGTVRIEAAGLRVRSGPGAGLPPANATARLDLAGQSARVDARIIAGPSNLALNGTVPLTRTGPIDLRADGSVNLALADAVLPASTGGLRGQAALEARLAGTLARPTGTVRVNGSGIRAARGPGAMLPPANVTARLDLAGESAKVDARIAAGTSNLALNGTVPLTSAGPMDVRATGRLSLAMADAILPASTQGARGDVALDARLTGTLARPTGTVRVNGSGIRLTRGPGAALPPASIAARLDLAGPSARVDARVTAGTTDLALAGTVPLSLTGAMSLRATGRLNLAMADPILLAGGRRLRGEVTLDATITGTPAAPRGAGTMRLAGGEVQDYVQGIHITGITATAELAGDTLRIVSFTGQAGPGAITIAGSIGLLAPGMPVNLTVTARGARPLVSDRLTADMDASVTIRGAISGQVVAAGSIVIRRAEITVPDKFPSSVAVLNVRVAGQPPPPPSGPPLSIGLDLTLTASQGIFVRGHGLDAELAGRLRLTGNLTAPQITGGFTLRSGTFNFVGQTLTFSRGLITFTGTGLNHKIDPSLDFEADSTNAGVTAMLKVTGFASAPVITLSSYPPLPQDEILARLLFGQSVKDLSAFQYASIAAGIAELSGTTGGFNPLNDIRKGLGLDRLNITSGGAPGGGPALEGGRYVAPGIFVGAKQGTGGSQNVGTQGVVQIDLYKGLKLETDVGTGYGANSVGLKYQFNY